MKTCKALWCNGYTISGIALLACLTFGFVGCRQNTREQVSFANVQFLPSAAAVNINTASVEELQKIPYIGEKMADRIIEHRERYGPFRRAEDLILIPGISDSRFRKIRSLIRVD